MSTSSRSVSSESANVPSVPFASPRSVSLENAKHQVPVQVFEGHEYPVFGACFYPDENKLVSGSQDGTLRVWDQKTGLVQVWSGHIDAVWDVDVSRDGKMVASGSYDKTIRIWDAESGETMHVLEGHQNAVRSVEFSRDSTSVVSGSFDQTVRVWTVETGELAFEPIECHGGVYCVRCSLSGDRIASGAMSVQIWNAKTGSGILSIRNSFATSLVWTADGTHAIGGGQGNITIWNPHSGEQLRTWKAHDNTDTVITLSLSPTGTHLATSDWEEKRASVFDISTGEQVAAFKHSQNSHRIGYSPSGRFIATGCQDTKVYVWEAPTFEDPHTKAQKLYPPSFSWLDRPAVPLAGPSRNDGMDRFGDSQPDIHHLGKHRGQQPSSQLQRVFNKVKDKFAQKFARGPAVVSQTSPVQDTVEPVNVAAGKDKVFWVAIERIVWTPLNTFIFMAFYCRKPGPEERRGFAPINRNTKANSSQAAATTNQPEHPETVHGAGNIGASPDSPPIAASNSVIRTQLERTAAMSLSGTENRGAGPDSSSPETIEMVARGRSSVTPTTPLNLTVPAHASLGPHSTPSTDPLSPAVTFCEASSSTVIVASPQLSVSSNRAHPTLPSSQHIELQSANTLSPEEMALIQEYRRLRDTSVAISIVAQPLSGPVHDRESYVRHEPSTPPRQPRSVTPSTPSTPFSSSPQARSQTHAAAFPVFDVAPTLLSLSRHSIHHPLTTNDTQPLDLTVVSTHDTLFETPLVSATQPTVVQPTNTEEGRVCCEEMDEMESEIPYYGA